MHEYTHHVDTLNVKLYLIANLSLEIGIDYYKLLYSGLNCASVVYSELTICYHSNYETNT